MCLCGVYTAKLSSITCWTCQFVLIALIRGLGWHWPDTAGLRTNSVLYVNALYTCICTGYFSSFKKWVMLPHALQRGVALPLMPTKMGSATPYDNKNG